MTSRVGGLRALACTGPLGLCSLLASLTPTLAAIDVDLALPQPCLALDGDSVHDFLGQRVAHCDVNGDGWTDAVLANPLDDGVGGVRNTAGGVSVVLGRPGAWSGTLPIGAVRSTRIIGPDTFDEIGHSLACADLDKDGYDDILAAAHFGDGPSNSRQNAGEIHIIRGGSSLPALIDLATYPHSVIQGAISLERMGEDFVVADINGDGWLDIVAGAPNGSNSAGTITSGRAYGFLGRAAWPMSLDALTERDFIIYGGTGDGFAVDLAAGDLNGDGTADLAITARLADGPSNSRANCGEDYIFRGKASWPVQFDLNVQSPDTIIYGVDAGDQVGWIRGIAIGDYDGASGAELVLGSDLADGKLNDATMTGELRVVRFTTTFPPTLDLRVSTEEVVFGAAIQFQFGSWFTEGDVDGDGQTDFIATTRYADGPNGNLSDAGEGSVFRGGAPWPAESTMPTPAFVRIYGAGVDDALMTPGTADLNGDGLSEIIVGAGLDVPTRLSRLWVCSPFDADLDGVQQLADNCPQVANPSQLDSDADRIGDLCQGDYDGDGLADTADCAPRSAAGGRPSETAAVRWDSESLLRWDASPFADRYDLLRVTLPGIAPSQFGDCINSLDADPTNTELSDTQSPAPGQGLGYLVRGRNLLCALAGTWGNDSSGTERQNDDPESCP